MVIFYLQMRSKEIEWEQTIFTVHKQEWMIFTVGEWEHIILTAHKQEQMILE
jgi:hypothetical protein